MMVLHAPVSVSMAQPPLTTHQPVHLIGIGGAGMSSLAQLLLACRVPVSGSDAKDSATLQLLSSLGAKTFIGHARQQVPPEAIVVYSSAVDANNPERQQALEQGLPLWHRSQLLFQLLQGPLPGFQTTVGISGTHGKTTLTGMLGGVLAYAGQEPTVIAGGRLPGLPGNVRVGSRFEIAVAELDESDGTILAYTPTITVLANLELDHADHYQDGVAGLEATFRQYLSQLVEASATEAVTRTVIANAECPLSRKLLAEFEDRLTILWLGFSSCPAELSPTHYYQIQPISTDADGCIAGHLVFQGEPLGVIKAGVPGRHNLYNACLTTIAALQLGVSVDQAATSLRTFSGMGRRFERVGRLHGALLVDDYAHHPTEVQETTRAAKALVNPGGQLWAIFQPHRYSRLQALWQEFSQSFALADQVLLLDVYSAGEAPIDGITSEALSHAVASHHPAVRYCASFEVAQAILEAEVKPEDLVLGMGAGTITTLLRTHPARQPLEEA